jgi:hypothetical protein
LVWSDLVCRTNFEWDEAVITSVVTNQPNNYLIKEPLQICLLDFLKSGDWQFVLKRT